MSDTNLLKQTGRHQYESSDGDWSVSFCASFERGTGIGYHELKAAMRALMLPVKSLG